MAALADRDAAPRENIQGLQLLLEKICCIPTWRRGLLALELRFIHLSESDRALSYPFGTSSIAGKLNTNKHQQHVSSSLCAS
ncbi:uncharacterized protein ACIBXB_014221 isoform 2-T2 [Morphnus guianensis]